MIRAYFLLLASLAVAQAATTAKLRSAAEPREDSKAKATSPAASAEDPAVLVGAGDIARCPDLSGATATGQLLDAIPGTVFALGDLAIPKGMPEPFPRCYEPTWGRQKARTRPVPGNEDYKVENAVPYFRFFGSTAGDPSKGYYSYELGAWHVIALNSNCSQVGGCGSGSAEERWLREDLASHPAPCTVAYWHHPLFSSGATHGDDPEVKTFWQDLYDAHAEIVLNGHDHDYERFAPQDPSGKSDPEHGIREFIVGTGGNNLRKFATPEHTSEFRYNDTFGLLKLTLHPHRYEWQFISVKGSAVIDSGSGKCH